MLILAAVLLSSQSPIGSQLDMSKGVVAKEDGDKIIGKVKWLIQENATLTLVGKGEKEIRLKDVTIVPMGSIGGLGQLQVRSLNLSDGFRLQLVTSNFAAALEPKDRGFGMVAEHANIDTFCWEWFNITAPDRATKKQESGELGIVTRGAGVDWMVSRTEFLTEVSFRVEKSELIPKTRAPFWRVRIFKGSHIQWPMLVNGKVVDSATLPG